MERIDTDVNGEWNFYLILDQFNNSEAESKRAAAGWAGDRYAIYEASSSNEVCLAQLSVWDTENDAREFFEAYAKRTKRRYADAKATEAASGNAERRQWTTNEGGVLLEIRDSRVLVIEGIPPQANTKSLLSTAWQ